MLRPKVSTIQTKPRKEESTFRGPESDISVTPYHTSGLVFTGSDPGFVDVVRSVVRPLCEDHGTRTQGVTATHRRLVALVTVEEPRTLTLVRTGLQVERLYASLPHGNVLVVTKTTVPSPGNRPPRLPGSRPLGLQDDSLTI